MNSLSKKYFAVCSSSQNLQPPFWFLMWLYGLTLNSLLCSLQKIKTSGVIDFDKQIYLYSLNEKGAPGFSVVNPIIINNKNFLLNRGWIPFDKKNTKEIEIYYLKKI